MGAGSILGEGPQDRQPHDQRALGNGGGEAILSHRLQAAALLDPADGYYEWQKQGKKKIPSYIQHAERDVFAFAGLWESWKQPDESWLHTCAILTTEANEKLRPIHHRMAVIIEPEDYDLWLAPRELVGDEWKPLMLGPRPEQLTFHEVSTDVNSPANDNPTLVLPYEST